MEIGYTKKGCEASISKTIKVRTNGLVSKGEEIIQVLETPMMGDNGNSLAAIKMYESEVIPALLINSESWIGLTDINISELQTFQDKFMRKLLRLPPSTPKAIIHWDSRLQLMTWRIVENKLLFLRKTMMRDENNVTGGHFLSAA